MCGKHPIRKPGSFGCRVSLAALAAVVGLCGPARAADNFWDGMLETLNVKATPAAPAPAFVERTRPDPAGLGYLPTAVPHRVSPLAVKSADQIQARKDALDAAQQRQLDPGAPAPLQVAPKQVAPKQVSPQRVAKARKPAAERPAPAVAD